MQLQFDEKSTGDSFVTNVVESTLETENAWSLLSGRALYHSRVP